MENEDYTFNKNQLSTKYHQSVKDFEYENLINEKNEIEKNEKYKFFSEQICEIITSSDSILKAYYESDYLKMLKNSDKIISEMKKYISKNDPEELSSIINDINNFEFDYVLKKVINSEIKKNINSFIDNYKCVKKSNALKLISEIKYKFESTFPNQNFDIIEFEKKTNEKIREFKFTENEINEIKDIASNYMIEKFIELINNELNYLTNNINN